MMRTQRTDTKCNKEIVNEGNSHTEVVTRIRRTDQHVKVMRWEQLEYTVTNGIHCNNWSTL